MNKCKRRVPALRSLCKYRSSSSVRGLDVSIGHNVSGMEQWRIGIDAWIFQDGNYPGFRRGQDAEFAIEFYFRDAPRRCDPERPSALRLHGASYDLTATVIAAVDGAWVIDCGIAAYQECALPPGIGIGESVNGVAYLGVDPFFYFERLHEVPGMPPLISSAGRRSARAWRSRMPSWRIRCSAAFGWR